MVSKNKVDRPAGRVSMSQVNIQVRGNQEDRRFDSSSASNIFKT